MAPALSRYQHVIIVIASCLTVVGCTGQVPPPQATTAELPTVTMSPQRTSSTAPATQTPAPVVTAMTETPTRPAPATRIPRPTGTGTWTPVPTLPADQAAQALLELYEGEAGCALPCWWGIVPGQTTWAEARDRLAPMDTESRPFETTLGSRYDFEFAVPPDLQGQVYLGPSIAVKDGQVIGISLNSSAISRDFDYSLAGWLQALGVPEEVWLFVQFDSMGLPNYDLDLFYPSKGVMVNGTGFTEARGDEFVICPVPFQRSIFPNAVVLWSPELDVNHDNIMEDVLGLKRDQLIVKFRPLEAWTDDWGPDEFYATYELANTSACFEVHAPATP